MVTLCLAETVFFLLGNFGESRDDDVELLDDVVCKKIGNSNRTS